MRQIISLPLPTSAAFDIPKYYQETFNHESFIYPNRMVQKKRMILFANDKLNSNRFFCEVELSTQYVLRLPRTIPAAIYNTLFEISSE